MISSYDVDSSTSVSELASAAFGNLAITDSRSVSGNGNIAASQRYSLSGGYTGSASFTTTGSGSLTGSADLNPGSMSASQVVSGSGSSASADVSLASAGSSLSLGSGIASGSMISAQKISTGSVHASQDTVTDSQSGQVWSSSTKGSYTSWDLSGYGEIRPIHDRWTSLDGSHYITNDLSGMASLYSVSGSITPGINSVVMSQVIDCKEGKLNSAQSAGGSSNGDNGETLLASDLLTAEGSVSGIKQAVSGPADAFVSQRLIVNGDAIGTSSSFASSDSSSSSVRTEASNADGLYLGTFSTTYNNLFEGQIIHRTQAGGDAIGYTGIAGSVTADAYSGYLGSYEAQSHGKWNNGGGDLNIGSKTVRAAVADVELKTNGNAAETSTSSIKDSVVMSGLKNTAAAEQSAQIGKFQSHLYSHSYPVNTYGIYDDPSSELYHKLPSSWEEFISTASGGIEGDGAATDISRWESGWTPVKSYHPAEGEANTFKATDITTTLPGSETWDQIWDGTERTRIPSVQVPWNIKYLYNNPDLTSTCGGRGVDVTVLDGGADTLHPDLITRIDDYFDIARGGGFEYQNGVPDDTGHGTHVSGILAADGGFDGQGIYGMAPEANLHEYKAFENNNGYFEDAAYGIYRATDLGSDIISNSWVSDTESPIAKKAFDYSIANDVLEVAAAGNKGPDPFTIEYPAKWIGVIGVGSFRANGMVSPGSSRGFNDGDGILEGNEIAFVAPGDFILSTVPTYGSWYSYRSGTSMACPHISGLSAKLLSGLLYDGYKPGDMLGIMMKMARPLPQENGQSNYRDNPLTGFGVPRLPEGSS